MPRWAPQGGSVVGGSTSTHCGPWGWLRDAGTELHALRDRTASGLLSSLLQLNSCCPRYLLFGAFETGNKVSQMGHEELCTIASCPAPRWPSTAQPSLPHAASPCCLQNSAASDPTRILRRRSQRMVRARPRRLGSADQGEGERGSSRPAAPCHVTRASLVLGGVCFAHGNSKLRQPLNSVRSAVQRPSL